MIEVYLFPLCQFQHINTDVLRKSQCKDMWEQTKNIERKEYKISEFEDVSEVDGFKYRAFMSSFHHKDS